MNRLLKFLADVAGHPVLGVKLNERKFPHSHLVALVAFRRPWRAPRPRRPQAFAVRARSVRSQF